MSGSVRMRSGIEFHGAGPDARKHALQTWYVAAVVRSQ